MHIPLNELLLYKLFLSHPDRSFYMQEIGRILKKKPGVFQRTLNKIEEEGFILSEFIANARFFKLNPDYPVLKEVTSIVKKMYGELDIYSRDIEKLDQEAKTHSKTQKQPPAKMKKPVKKNLAEIREETFDPAPFQEAPKPKSEKTKNPKKIRKESSGTESAKPGKRSITLKDFQSEEMLSSLKKPEELNEEEPEISETPEKTEPEKKSPAPESAEETPKSRKYLKKDLSSIWEEELKLHDAKKAQKKSSLTKEQLELF